MSKRLILSNLDSWIEKVQKRRISSLQFNSFPSASCSNKYKRKCSSYKDVKQNNEFKIQRKWEHVRRANQSKTSQQLSILSYNILGQTLLKENYRLYTDINPDYLKWKFRWKNLSSEIKSFNSDIICLQEVEDSYLSKDINPCLERMGYITKFKQRTGGRPDGVLTAVKKDKFQVLLTVPVEYFKDNEPLANRFNVGLIVIAKMKSSGAILCICNTHLLYNTSRGDIKLVQLCTFLAEIDRVLKEQVSKYNNRPAVLICGDFNSTPTSSIFNFITDTQLKYESLLCQSVSGQQNSNRNTRLLPVPLLPQSLNITSNCNYGSDKKPDSSKLSHTIGSLSSSHIQHKDLEVSTLQDNGITVDYIFFSNFSLKSSKCNKISRVELKLKKKLSLPDREEVKRVQGFPNQRHSSDHLPVAAHFFVRAFHPSQ